MNLRALTIWHTAYLLASIRLHTFAAIHIFDIHWWQFMTDSRFECTVIGRKPYMQSKQHFSKLAIKAGK